MCDFLNMNNMGAVDISQLDPDLGGALEEPAAGSS